MLTRTQLIAVSIGFLVAIAAVIITDACADRALKRRVEALEARDRPLGTNWDMSVGAGAQLGARSDGLVVWREWKGFEDSQ